MAKLEQKRIIDNCQEGGATIRMYSRYFLEDGRVITLITTKKGDQECVHTLFSPQPDGKVLRRTGDFQSLCLLTGPDGAPMPLDINELNLILLVEKSFGRAADAIA